MSLPPIDWDLAAHLGGTLAAPGPRMDDDERAQVVAELQDVAREAHGHAVGVSGLPDPGVAAPVEVMGRARWIEANVASAIEVTALTRDDRPREEWSLLEKVQARAVAAQAGGALAWVSGRIIGQFDPFAPTPALYFCAPNVVMVERELGVVPRDFRLWVAVHELTHRLQFARAPWLRERLQGLLADVLRDEDAGGREPAGRRLRGSLMNLVATPEQQRLLDEMSASMSVLEGHAEVMMDAVGPEVVPTIGAIRPAFQARRRKGGLDAVMRKMLGMDVKLAQYRDGAAFCRAVLAEAGLDGLNRVWDSPETFPSHAELFAPADWLRRLG